jgi:hypothetical protein
MFADPLALRLEPTACKTVMALSMADRPPAIDVLYPESAPSISTGSGTQPRSLRHSALLRLRCRFAKFRRFYLTIPHASARTRSGHVRCPPEAGIKSNRVHRAATLARRAPWELTHFGVNRITV